MLELTESIHLLEFNRYKNAKNYECLCSLVVNGRERIEGSGNPDISSVKSVAFSKDERIVSIKVDIAFDMVPVTVKLVVFDAKMTNEFPQSNFNPMTGSRLNKLSRCQLNSLSRLKSARSAAEITYDLFSRVVDVVRPTIFQNIV